MAATYDAGPEEAGLATAQSTLTGERVNRFLHVAQNPADLVAQGKMQRRLGQVTGTCFQRCVGMDAINSLFSLTFDVDASRDTAYHQRFTAWLAMVQHRNLVVGGAMTDVKGDRSKAPAQQDDPDLFVHVVERRPGGIVIRGAKAHQTGAINSHWLLVMPGQRLEAFERFGQAIGHLRAAVEGEPPLVGDAVQHEGTVVQGRIAPRTIQPLP